MQFKDRTQAGQLLAQRLRPYARRPDAVVLALPRGGVPVAYEVARALELPLDLCLVRKLGVPGHCELAMGAIAPGGVKTVDWDLVRSLNISDEAIARVEAREQRELERRERLYRGDRPGLNLGDRTVILIDDGIATGSTLRAAIGAIREQQPRAIVVAVPVAPPQTCTDLQQDVDRVLCLLCPQHLYSISAWYEDFSQTSDEEVCQLLARANKLGIQT
ncbi:phosphoribosyltransferase [Oxynema sp. CENA135]|uniref:phosphoribosyltransferase n=1 Tax=Oxynema sp. CENA135 TaxID=984206 RepID=UPI0019094616|nr:phosphoribosyltransferase [Oxynema sp. CENA135]MBK4730030.1 phosphoribosyltransferase [Oxynema sp. CENA135]